MLDALHGKDNGVHSTLVDAIFLFTGITMLKKSSELQTKEAHNFKKQIEALSKISAAIASELYLEDILRVMVSITAQVMGSKICSLLLLDEEKQELVVRATQSISEEYNRKPNIKLGKGIAGRVALENKPVIVLDVRRDSRYLNADIAQKEGLHALLSVPLAVKGKVIGVLNCYSTALHNYTETEVAVLTTVAAEAAMVIENQGLANQTKKYKEELETRKIIDRAKDLLSRNLCFSADDAYRRIQKQSMDTRKSMREIAEAIILSEQIKKS